MDWGVVMKEILLYCDGSFRRLKQGNASLIIDKENQKEKTLIYRNGTSYDSQEAELNSVIFGLEYIKEYSKLSKDTGYAIEINTDVDTIVEFTNEKIYLEWDSVNWKRRGKPIWKNIKLWYKLMLLLKYFGEENITANKINSETNEMHRIAHIVSYRMSSKYYMYMKTRNFHLNQFDIMPNLNTLFRMSTNITIPEMKLDKPKSEMPWVTKNGNENDFRNKIKWYDKINEEIIEIQVADIILEDEIHLRCESVTFNGRLYEYAKKGMIVKPVVVRKVEQAGEFKYVLVMGVQRFFAAKILDIKTIPAVIVPLNHLEFKSQLS